MKFSISPLSLTSHRTSNVQFSKLPALVGLFDCVQLFRGKWPVGRVADQWGGAGEKNDDDSDRDNDPAPVTFGSDAGQGSDQDLSLRGDWLCNRRGNLDLTDVQVEIASSPTPRNDAVSADCHVAQGLAPRNDTKGMALGDTASVIPAREPESSLVLGSGSWVKPLLFANDVVKPWMTNQPGEDLSLRGRPCDRGNLQTTDAQNADCHVAQDLAPRNDKRGMVLGDSVPAPLADSGTGHATAPLAGSGAGQASGSGQELSSLSSSVPAPYNVQRSSGTVLVLVVVLIFVVSLVILAILGNATMQLRLVRKTQDKELAFHIAEAGANYYQWHLAHFPIDYADGTGQTNCNPCGPYVRDYTDFDTGQVVGRYSLTITPPPVGTTVVTIASTGYTIANPGVTRTVTVRYGIPSLAQYAFLTNADVWIGSGENVSGQMSANGGIRFDGTANAPIRSAKTTYNCPSWSGSPCPTTKPGIWGSAAAASQSYWQYPVPNVDFSSMTSDLAAMKASAQSGGLYLAPSNALGYSLVFNADGTITVYKVTSLRSMSGITAYDVNWASVSPTVDYQNRALQFTQAIPANGVLFIEDHVWVEGTVRGRAQVTAAKLPYNATTAPNIYIPNNILYTAKDGTDVLGLIAQKHIVATYYTPDNLEVDAALIAQNGSVQRYYFSGGSSNIRNSITVYGSLGTFGQWTWSYVSGSTVTSGFVNTYTNYDANLLYGPPPSFPLTTDGYQQMSWESN